MHLKVIQQMAQILRLSYIAFQQVLAVGTFNNSSMAAGGSDEMDGRINPDSILSAGVG
jgi:hypothetical protein